MFPSGDPTLLGPKPESQESKARSAVQKELKDFARRSLGIQDLPPHLDKFIEDFADGPKRRVIEGTDVLPKGGGTFETDRDALYCKCGQLYESHNDPYVFCAAARKAIMKEDFDPFSTVGYLSRMEHLKEDE